MNQSLLRTLILAGTAWCTLGLTKSSIADTTFLFEYSGIDVGNTASASGWITFADGFPEVPAGSSANTQDYFIGEGEVLALSITVAGSSIPNANGTWTDADFLAVSWWSAGSTLDLTTEAIGQTTESGGAWGTPDGQNGDFNLVAIDPFGPTPFASFFNTLDAGGLGGESMFLTSFRPVPVPGSLAVFVASAAFVFRRRRAS